MVTQSRSSESTELSRFAQQLVQTPSISTREGDLAVCVVDEMRRIGFETRVDTLGNVIGHIGNGHGKTLLFDAHMDTVDVSDLSQWHYDPFGGEIDQGVLYGRGACDMKGGLAAMVHAGRSLVTQQAKLKGDLYVVGVVQEEPCEGLAIQHVIENEGLHPDWVVIGEPTNLQIARGQRGRMEVRIAISGRSCHASAPKRGINAIYEAARVIVSLELLAPQLHDDSFLGKGSIAVTSIESTASSRNVVPDSCTLYVDRRLTIGETEIKALAEIEGVLSREGAPATVMVTEYENQSYTGATTRARQYFPFWVTAEDHPLLRQAARTIGDTLGFVPFLGKWEFSTDGVYTAGVAGIPTIGFGPGEERYAHTANEQVRIRDLEAASLTYAELARRLLSTT